MINTHRERQSFQKNKTDDKILWSKYKSKYNAQWFLVLEWYIENKNPGDFDSRNMFFV